MCREHPGPRCSNGGKIRINRADKHLAEMQKKYDKEVEANGKPTPHRQRLLDNAIRRREAAERVYLSTPAGQKNLQERIDQLEHKLGQLPQGSRFSRERRAYNATKRELTQATSLQRESAQDRKNQYADLARVKDERRLVRDQARAQGAKVSKNAQPLTHVDIDAVMESNRMTALSLREWNDEDYSYAPTWVERGTNTGWAENNRVTPPAGSWGSSNVPGERVKAPVSRFVRMNTPDGQIVEGRADVHLLKRNDGKFVVAERLTVASTWEDTTPIHKTTQEPGHLLNAKIGTNRRPITTITEFKSATEAEAHVRKSRNRLNQTFVKDVARLGREAMLGRAKKPHEKLQKRGWRGWPRYAAAE